MTDLADINIAGQDVAAIDDDTLLYGPPGTGKTTQAAKRVIELTENDDYSIEDVCWVTYRRDLAQETLDDLVNYGLLDKRDLHRLRQGRTRWIGTMHAVGYRLAKDVLSDPIDDERKAEFASHYNLRYEPGAVHTSRGELLFRTFHWLRGQRLDPTNPAHVRKAPSFRELQNRGWDGDIPRIYDEWTDYLGDDYCEFADMLSEPLDRELSPPTDILVLDELHDFNRLMLDTALMWAQNADVVVAAGDPEQVINWFDGARRDYFAEARDELGLTKILLDTSHRVFSTAGAIAEQVLSNAHSPPPVDRPVSGDVFEYRSPALVEDGGGWSVPAPSKEGSPVWLLDQYPRGSTMFLARVRAQVQALCRALDTGGVIYQSQRSFNGWRETLILNLHNALQKLAMVDITGLDTAKSNWSLEQVGEGSSPSSVEFSEDEVTALLDHTPAKYLSGTRSEITEYLDSLEMSVDGSKTAVDIHEWVESEFWEQMVFGSSVVQEFNKTGPVTYESLSDRNRVRLLRALKRYDEPVPADDIPVSVLTIHASKGKEAADVVVYDGITQRVRRRMDTLEDAEKNEWRTWYVALTRAAKRLHVMRNAFEWTSPIIPKNIIGIAQSKVSTVG